MVHEQCPNVWGMGWLPVGLPQGESPPLRAFPNVDFFRQHLSQSWWSEILGATLLSQRRPNPALSGFFTSSPFSSPGFSATSMFLTLDSSRVCLWCCAFLLSDIILSMSCDRTQRIEHLLSPPYRVASRVSWSRVANRFKINSILFHVIALSIYCEGGRDGEPLSAPVYLCSSRGSKV